MRFAKTITGMLCTGLLLASFPVGGVEKTGTARVEIMSALTVTEETVVDFGRIINQDGTCTMRSGGQLSGTPGMGCTGQETPGVFNIVGKDGAYVEVQVANGPAIDGVQFRPVIDGQSVYVLSLGDAKVRVVGDLVLAGATDGQKELSYTFTANYQ